MSDAGIQQDNATITIGGTTTEYPLVHGTEGAPSIDVSALTKKTGYTALDYGFVNTAAMKRVFPYLRFVAELGGEKIAARFSQSGNGA